MMKHLLGCALLLTLVGCTTSSMDVPAVTSFDARRYVGDWYEIARMPSAYNNLEDVTYHHELFGNGVIFVKRGYFEDREREITYRGPFEDKRSVGELRLKFLYDFGMLYRVIWISPDYDVAMVTSEVLNDLWIFAREKKIPKEQYDKLVKMAKDWGFDVDKLEMTPHTDKKR